ncbi:MAG TPA: response regulator transcription factor [Methylomirabilota bacterium]|nr:response regulator transcription factor [Methylomirabilota bacterium]
MTNDIAEDAGGPTVLSRTVVVADDHPIMQDTVVRILKKRFGARAILKAATYGELLDLMVGGQQDPLVITDLVMPGMRGLDSLKKIRDLAPAALVVVYSSNASQALADTCLELGMKGFIGKRAGETDFAFAIAEVLEGRTAVMIGDNPSATSPAILERVAFVGDLSPQQMKVFQLLGDGLLNKQIAYNLGISEATVKAHVGKILETLRITSRSQAAICSAWMVEHGLI